MDLTDRVLALLQTRFPQEFEICGLAAQTEVRSAQVADLQAGDDADEELGDTD